MKAGGAFFGQVKVPAAMIGGVELAAQEAGPHNAGDEAADAALRQL